MTSSGVSHDDDGGDDYGKEIHTSCTLPESSSSSTKSTSLGKEMEVQVVEEEELDDIDNDGRMMKSTITKLLIGISIVIVTALTVVGLGVIIRNNKKKKQCSGDDMIIFTLAEVPTNIFEFPLEFAPSDYITDNNNNIHFRIPISESNTIITLTKKKVIESSSTTSSTTTYYQPIGRSYDGRQWEVSAGKFVQSTMFSNCDETHCLWNFNRNNDSPIDDDNNDDEIYSLMMYEKPTWYTNQDIAARFLEQATMGGGTTSEINDLVSSDLNFALWMQSQHQLPLMQSSHRALFRQHLNAQHSTPSVIGPITQPCEKGTRYRLTAFSKQQRHEDKIFVLTTIDNVRVMTLLDDVPFDATRRQDDSDDDDQRLRIIVPSKTYSYNRGRDRLDEREFPDGEYVICRISDDFDSNNPSDLTSGISMIKIARLDGDDDDDNNRNCYWIFFEDQEFYGTSQSPAYYSNPLFRFDESMDIWPSSLIEFPDDTAQPINEQYYKNIGSTNQEIILSGHYIDVNDGSDVCTTHNIGSSSDRRVFARWRGGFYIYESRFLLYENTVESPLPDGGGEVVANIRDRYGVGDEGQLHYEGLYFGPICSNVHRSFANEDSCFLSESPHVCSSSLLSSNNDNDGDAGNNNKKARFRVTDSTIRIIYEETLQDDDHDYTMYFYAIDALNITRDPTCESPCTAGAASRWIPVTCSPPSSLPAGREVGAGTIDVLSWLIDEANQRSNRHTQCVDIVYPSLPQQDFSCDDEDLDLVGYEVPDLEELIVNGENWRERQGRCWRNVHPDHLNVYDFTSWTQSHPGNSDNWNPITEFAEEGESRLTFPSWHELIRWNSFKDRLGTPVALGKRIRYDRLPAEIRTDRLAEALGIGVEDDDEDSEEDDDDSLTTTTVHSNLVCGSPFEVANVPELGGTTRMGEFSTPTHYNYNRGIDFSKQREIAWTMAVLTDPGQLRQRIAWALSQILVVSPNSFSAAARKSYTEPFLMYYDIFIRNAFGNYRDVLKEVSYSPMMAKMLSYYTGKSTAYVQMKRGIVSYADENYAREIMQLFTTGLFQLNMNGTQRLDQDANRQRVYTNDDIEEYARAWTGFESEENRGNVEGDLVRSRRIDPNIIDPLHIISDWRDPFPKMGLDRMYVGDHYPLCSDLPGAHFLKPGATYRLLGRSAIPEMQEDPVEWNNDDDAVHVTLDEGSQLYSALCEPNGGQCKFPSKVVLNSTLLCTGIECEVDTLRSVEVTDGIFYEYIRLPCAARAYFNDAKVLAKNKDGGMFICGDPTTEVASVACCNNGNLGWNEMFFGERTLFSTAQDRCAGLCSYSNGPNCNEGGSRCADNNYFWSNLSCSVFAKINSVGKVAIVHGSNDIRNGRVDPIVDVDSNTFFRVNWDGNYGEILSNCQGIDSCTPTNDGACICAVDVSDEQVFHDVPTKEEIRYALYIGAFDSMITSSASNLVMEGGIIVHTLDADESLNIDTVFEFVDENGLRQLRKNMLSTVTIRGTDMRFRNPPHLISLADPESRDAHYETDATIDHLFYHPSTPPFLAIRFAQRFGISNPSPNYVESIARAFQTGSFVYSSSGGSDLYFGTGKYGDLAASFAATLLHPEARNVVLDADPTHGSFKEPLLKILGLMRSLGFELRSDKPWVEFGDRFGEKIGQMAHQIPSVFSFFLPEHQPPGPISQAGLVAPEAQRQTEPRIVASLNGIFSIIKFGLNPCYGGFGDPSGAYFGGSLDCSGLRIGDLDRSTGNLTYYPSNEGSSRSVVDELATLMTAGRLSPENRAIVERMFSEESDEAFRKAQLVIASSPEFHTTNIVRKTGEERQSQSTRSPSNRPYKALVYLLLRGGCDSYNMLVPHSCSGTNSVGQSILDQYLQVRSTVALTEEERSRIISAENQPCEEFAVHPDLPLVERLYNAGELSFFANAGALDVPVTKDNYYALTQSELFAHNMMQHEAQRTDPFGNAPDTGILGRMCDALQANGYNPQPISIQNAAIATVGRSTAPIVMSVHGNDEFAPVSNHETFDIRNYTARMNDATSAHSSIFGETWSQKLQKAIVDADLIAGAFEGVELTQETTDLSDYEEKMQILSQVILSHDARGSDRDVIFLQLNKWDHHSSLKEDLSTTFRDLDSSLTSFEQEMKAQGMWGKVTIILTSEFGRTLTPNSSDGSDHAWGGNYMIMGGAVKGKQIHGDYPSDLTDAGPLNIGRGRLIPTLSWESILNGPLEWMGVESDEDLDYCMPNRHRTGATLLSKQQVFHDEISRTLRGNARMHGLKNSGDKRYS